MSAAKIHPIDIHVGMRLRERRKVLGITQGDLAVSIGLTFQQVQKYERGTNRISASKLYDISQTLKVSIAYFFDAYRSEDGADVFELPASETFVNGFLMTTEGMELAETFPRITKPKYRRRLLDLVKALGDSDE
jgi:transcriptional regulator with XRE-family HTH domain